MPIHAPFWGVLGHISPNDVTHHPNSKKDRPWAKPHHLSHKPRKSVARFELAVWTRKKDRTGKVTKGLYFTYLWRSPHWSNVHENLCYRKSNFPFFLLISNGPYNLQQCSATALPVIQFIIVHSVIVHSCHFTAAILVIPDDRGRNSNHHRPTNVRNSFVSTMLSTLCLPVLSKSRNFIA